MSSLAFGPLAISVSRLLVLLGFVVAVLLDWWLGRRRGVNVEPSLTGMLLVGFVTARTAFVLLYLEDYLIRL